MPKHYDTFLRKNLTAEDIKNGFVEIKLDPYRIAKVYKTGGGAREQILKKALRWTSKGGDSEQVLKEIKQACDRELEIIAEDNIPLFQARG